LNDAGPTAEDLKWAIAELDQMAGKAGIAIPGGSGYPELFADLESARAASHISAISDTDANRSKRFATVVKEYARGLRGRVPADAGEPNSQREAINLVWRANHGDVICAFEQLQVLHYVGFFLRYLLLLFFIVYALRAGFGAALAVLSQPNLPDLSLSATLILIGKTVANSLNNLLGDQYIMSTLIGALGALFGTYVELPQSFEAPHWRLVRRSSRSARVWAGATVGLLTAIVAPILLGEASIKGDAGASRIYVFAFVFGLSQELFLRRLLRLASIERKP
jgi:hypothetical protein